MEKDNIVNKDEHFAIGEEVQKITDDYVKKIDTIVAAKEKDILNT
jgi:ribosome recycling factor